MRVCLDAMAGFIGLPQAERKRAGYTFTGKTIGSSGLKKFQMSKQNFHLLIAELKPYIQVDGHK